MDTIEQRAQKYAECACPNNEMGQIVRNTAYQIGAREEHEELIEKACEWLWNNFYEHPHERWLICSESFDTIEYMIERFKASME